MPRSQHRRFAARALVAALITLAGPATAGAEYRWSPPQALHCCSIGAWDAGSDAAGNALLMLHDGPRIQLLDRPSGGSWSAPVAVSTQGRSSRSEDMAVAGSGAAAVIWIENQRRIYERVRAVVREPGGAFGAPVWLSPRPGRGVRNAQIAVDSAGNALAIWEARVRPYRTGHFVASYRPAGGQFGRPQRLSRDGARYATVALADGHGVVAWAFATRIEAATIERGKVAKARLNGTTGARSYDAYVAPGEPALAVGPGGGAVIAWAGRLPEPGRRVSAADIDNRPVLVRAAWRAPGGRFRDPVNLRVIHPRRGDNLGPISAAAGPAGRAIVAWRDENSQGTRRRVSRLRASLVGSSGRFGANFELTPAQGGFVTDPALAFVDGGGTFVAAWSWYLDDAHSGLQASSRRVGGAGSTSVVSAPLRRDESIEPHLAVDAQGTATVFWRQLVKAASGYGALFTATGTPVNYGRFEAPSG